MTLTKEKENGKVAALPSSTETALARTDSSLQAEASSAHSRINIPLNLDNWKTLPEEVQAELLWFHQYLLDHRLNYKDSEEALGYDQSTVFRVLKGTYTGSWAKIADAIRSYRRLTEQRGNIQKNEFVENSISRMIFAGLDYALANNSVTLVVGESRMGKSAATKAWRDANNHGRSVYVEVPPYGGAKALLNEVALSVGVNRTQSIPAMLQAILRSFNRNRILLVDEAHRLLPSDRRVNPVCLEILRHVHDKTGASLALLATERFNSELSKGHYQFEQLIGRIGMPIRLPRRIKLKDIEPIICQFIRRPGDRLMDQLLQIANDPGRLGIVVENLKVASRIATKAKENLREEHVFKAIALRRQMQGEQTYAAK